MDEQLVRLLEWVVVNRGKIIGTLAGILLGWLTIQYGFIKATFILLCLIVGYIVGASIDSGQNFQETLERILFSRRR